jgi:hypothetical protein
MKLSRQQVIDIYGVLFQLRGEKFSPLTAFDIVKNRNLAKAESEVLDEAREQAKIPEGVEAFEQKRLELCELYAEKDEEGKAKKIVTGVNPNGKKQEIFDITMDNQNKIGKELDDLKETEFKETFEEVKKIEDEFERLLNEELDIGFSKIPIKDLPKVTTDQIEILMPILEAD